MSDSKMCRNVFPCKKIKKFPSSRHQTLSAAVFSTTLFVTKIMCCRLTHDATLSTLLNSTDEANTFLTMYNITMFLRLSKLVSCNLMDIDRNSVLLLVKNTIQVQACCFLRKNYFSHKIENTIFYPTAMGSKEICSGAIDFSLQTIYNLK